MKVYYILTDKINKNLINIIQDYNIVINKIDLEQLNAKIFWLDPYLYIDNPYLENNKIKNNETFGWHLINLN